MTEAEKPGVILIVDDDFANRETLMVFLALDGYDVSGAQDGREALRMLRAGPLPRLVLLDLNMPRMNGRELLQEMARDPALAEVAVCLMSAGLPPIPPGIGFLEKPFDFEDLRRLVRDRCGPT